MMHNTDTPHGILVFGANGSGKTTLGRELARLLDCKHMDHEDYHFAPSEIPYTVERPYAECLQLMRADIEKHRTFVLSAVTGDFGAAITQTYRLAVLLSAPAELRLRRIEQRALDRYGPRVQPGGDMHEQQRRFLNFAATRPLQNIEQWAETLPCPVLRIDTTQDWRANAVNVAELCNKTITRSSHN